MCCPALLTVTKPERLARSTAELLAIEADLSKRGIGLAVLSMGGERLDTRNPTSKLMLTILAEVAPGFVDTARFVLEVSTMAKTRIPYTPELRRQMVALVQVGRSPEQLAAVPFSPKASTPADKTAQAWAFQSATAAISSANPTILRTRLRL